jgi:hypothetical protein
MENRVVYVRGNREFYVRNFKGERCVCGGHKQARISFCYQCFSVLSKEVQIGLYNALKSSAYGEAFESALDELKMSGRVK